MTSKKETNGNISVIINTAEEQRKASDVPALLKKAELTISTQPEYEIAGDVLKEVKARYKELDTQRKEITKPIDTAKKAVMDLFSPPLSLLEKAEMKIKGLMLGYTTEQERKAREEQVRLQRLADAQAEKEKKILDEKIARAEASGKTEKVAELEQKKAEVQAIDVPVIAPVIEAPKGISYRDKWSAEVIDFKALPDEYKIANQQALDKVAQATKGAITIPGVKMKSEKIIASRS